MLFCSGVYLGYIGFEFKFSVRINRNNNVIPAQEAAIPPVDEHPDSANSTESASIFEQLLGQEDIIPSYDDYPDGAYEAADEREFN